MTFLNLPIDVVLASIPAIGFALLFNVPKEFLSWCGIGGGCAHALRLALITYTSVPIETATFIAAAALSFVAVFAAKRLRAHPKVCTVAAMIPMVPGVAAYTAFIALIRMNQEGVTEKLIQTAAQSTLRVFFIVSALAIGLALPGLTWFRRRVIV
ncbi:MAG TPA: threonine/serine exporter family protein [Opitutaceae bacterium]